MMSHKKGLGFNKFTGQRAAGLGFHEEDSLAKNSHRDRPSPSSAPANPAFPAGPSLAGRGPSQAYTGSGYSITTYRDKMAQMNDQERIIEEKRRQIQARIDAKQKQAAKDLPLPAPAPKLPAIRMPGKSKPITPAKTVDTPKPNLLVNDGNFLERFKQMQQGGTLKSPSVDKHMDDSSKEKPDNPKTWIPGEVNRHKQQEEMHRKTEVPENLLHKHFRDKWESTSGRAERKYIFSSSKRTEDSWQDEGYRRSDRDRDEGGKEHKSKWNRNRSPSPKKSFLAQKDDQSAHMLQVKATLESVAMQQTVTEAIGMLKAAQPLPGPAFQQDIQEHLQLTGHAQLMTLPPGEASIQQILLSSQPGPSGEHLALHQLPQGPPPTLGPVQTVQIIQQPIQQMQMSMPQIQPSSQHIYVAAGPHLTQQTQLQLAHPQGPFTSPAPPVAQQQIVVSAPPPMQNLPPPGMQPQMQIQHPPLTHSPHQPLPLAPSPQPIGFHGGMQPAPISVSMSMAPPLDMPKSLAHVSMASSSGMYRMTSMSMAPPGEPHAAPMSTVTFTIAPPPLHSISHSHMHPIQPSVIQQQYNVPPPETISIQTGPVQMIDISQPPPQNLPQPPPQTIQLLPNTSQPPPFLSQVTVSSLSTPPPPFVSQAQGGPVPLIYSSQAPHFVSQPQLIETQPLMNPPHQIITHAPPQMQIHPSMSQAMPNMAQPPPSLTPHHTNLAPPHLSMSHPPPNVMPPVSTHYSMHNPTFVKQEPLDGFQPATSVQYTILPPPVFVKQEIQGFVEHQVPGGANEYTTVMGEYGPVMVKKFDLNVQRPVGGRPQVKSENAYDPAMPTEGDSPVKETNGEPDRKGNSQKRNSVSLPENPAAQEMIDSLAMMAACGGEDTISRIQEDAKVNPDLWFLSHTDSPEYKYFMSKLCELQSGSGAGAKDRDDSNSRSAKKRKRKSRWGPEEEKAVSEPAPQPLPQPHCVTLQEFSRRMVGSDTIDAEQLKQIREQREINMMYELILAQKKAHEAALMAELPGIKVKPKYEYDSDEETDEHGTWEHRNRMQEMEATRDWAEALTEAGRGKHHIGDFLPPDELERFMETFDALKAGRTPDYSDYKDFKIKCDNIGYQMLQKLGWKEGEGLGSEGQGITAPVNKGNVSVDGRGVGVERPDGLTKEDDEFDAYRKRMMLAYRFRPNPLNNPRRPYY
ncbi:hypothetical protein DPMN_106803 [Dreissena polymorpha]|uniref:G-patch domain-containing protein n=1 Tax=Dreissena polymorpha TaxID=45954 RepID=A0A9D4QKD7_DREPO|nr:hypothetical protein DPMN_106803 [Dreissena polymorpha]